MQEVSATEIPAPTGPPSMKTLEISSGHSSHSLRPTGGLKWFIKTKCIYKRLRCGVYGHVLCLAALLS